MVVRSGPPRRARMGLRLPARRPVALGDPRHSALRRPDTRRSLPRRLERDSRRPRHRGIPARERGAVAARRRARQWDADRAGRGRQLVGDPITGARRGPAELLSPLDLAERPRLPCGARSAVAGGRRGVGIRRGGYRGGYPAWRQPAESATPSPPPAAAHAPRRSRDGASPPGGGRPARPRAPPPGRRGWLSPPRGPGGFRKGRKGRPDGGLPPGRRGGAAALPPVSPATRGPELGRRKRARYARAGERRYLERAPQPPAACLGGRGRTPVVDGRRSELGG